MLLLDLPDCMLEQVFEYLSYDEMAKKRLVSKKINKVCQGLLNIGLNKMMKRHTYNLKKIKAQLPRRESERRVHVLAKHADILTCVETRISMLSMTYTKYIDLGLCCFIPGKIIDEVMAILQLVESTNKPLRSHEVLQELRDISSMAIDHFDEHIVPNLKKAFCEMSNQTYGSGSALYHQIMQTSSLEGIPDMLQAQIRDPVHRNNETNANRLLISRLDRRCESIMKIIQQVIGLQKRQARHIRNNTLQISELRSQMTEYRRRMEDLTANRTVEPPAEASTPTPPVYVSSASTSSSDSIEVLGSSPTSSGSSSSGSVSISPNSPYSYLARVSGRSSYKKATISIKRRIEEATELHQAAMKVRRMDDDDTE